MLSYCKSIYCDINKAQRAPNLFNFLKTEVIVNYFCKLTNETTYLKYFKMGKSSFITLLVSFILIVCNKINAQTAVAPTGTGTSCDPYQISSLDNLYWVTQTSASWAAGKYFIQTANIDASATSTYFSNGSGGYYGLPAIGGSSQAIGNQVTGQFYANYDGQGYTISNLYIKRNIQNVALFGATNNATIKNLILQNPTVIVNSGVSGYYGGNSLFVGGGSGTFDNIKILGGNFTSNNSFYGFCGGMFGRTGLINVSNCSLDAIININGPANSSGGFLGYTESACNFINCFSSGSITIAGSSYGIGGFIGGVSAYGSTFQKCYSSMNVTGTNTSGVNLGGFIGEIYKEATFTNCYATGNISSLGTRSGGFFGNSSTSASSINTSVVSNCYSTGSISGPYSGGFGGSSVSGTTITNCFWDTQTSLKSNALGIGTTSGITGKTTSEMKTQSTFTNASWDFNNSIWNMNSLINNNYPNLIFPTVTVVPYVVGVNAGTVSSNQVVCYNSNPANIVLTGSCGSIQWQSSIDNLTWTNINGATADVLTGTQIGVLTSTKYFRALLTGSSNSTYSSVVIAKVNNGLAFDGNGDFVSLGNHANLNFTNNFTIETWVKVPTIPSSGVNTIFSKKNPTANTPGYMFGFNNSNTSDLKLVFESAIEVVTSDRPVYAGEWNHVAVVVSANGTLATFYINGALAGSSTITLTNASSVDEFIGAMDLSGTNSLNSTLDELRIWNYALTGSDIILNIDNPLFGNETGLVAYFDFNQGIPSGSNTGLSLIDQTTNGIIGSFNGFDLVGTNSNFVQGNHLSIISPDATVCLASSSPRLLFGGTGKTPTAFQWFSNASASTTGATSISGSTFNLFDVPTATSGTKYYYINATGTCTNPINSNFAKVIVSGGITGNDYLYIGDIGNYTSTEPAAAVNPWVISNTTLATTTNTGVITAVSTGTPTLTYTTASGCVVNKTINVVPTTWKGTTSSDWNTGSNWIGLYVPTTVTNLVFDNAAVNDCVLDQNRTLASLNFGTSSKKLSLGNYNLTVNSITNNFSTRYIKTNGTGKLSLTVADNASVVFPVGNSSYNPVTITNKSGASDVFSGRVVDAVYVNGISGTSVTTPIVNRTWDITKSNSNAGLGVNFIFKWNSGEIVNGTLTTPKMNHHTGSNWEVPTVTSTTFTTNTLTVVGYTGTFSPFAISEGTNPLPVELTSFNANCTENTTTINWQTASEHNSVTFEVEKSRDGSNWALLAAIPTAGNSSSILDYSVVDDEKASAIVYYRLNQIDIDGDSKMYGPISANCNDSESFDAMVYPNPAQDLITLKLTNNETQNVSIQLIGSDGKVIYQITQLLNVGSTILPLSIKELKSGIYSLQIQSASGLRALKLVIL